MLQDFRVFGMAAQVYEECKATRVPLHLRDQLLRASSSVALNIAEGAAKMTAAEQRRHYAIALGSLREVWSDPKNWRIFT
jgi:four helix bundle protein